MTVFTSGKMSTLTQSCSSMMTSTSTTRKRSSKFCVSFNSSNCATQRKHTQKTLSVERWTSAPQSFDSEPQYRFGSPSSTHRMFKMPGCAGERACVCLKCHLVRDASLLDLLAVPVIEVAHDLGRLRFGLLGHPTPRLGSCFLLAGFRALKPGGGEQRQHEYTITRRVPGPRERRSPLRLCQ